MAGRKAAYRRYRKKRHWRVPAIGLALLLTIGLTTLVQGIMVPGKTSAQQEASNVSGEQVKKRGERIVSVGKRVEKGQTLPPPEETEDTSAEETKEQTASCVVTESEAVGDEYFADAIFVGDSRTEGFMLYSGLKGSRSFTTVGLTVSEVFNKKTVTVNGQKMTISDALATQSFSKVYIMLGINELGWVYPEEYQKQYGKIIDRIREINPDAQIYIQSILPVSAKKDAEGTYINNERIRLYNDLLLELAEEKDVAYVNVAEAVSDESGNLMEDASFDGEHLVPEYCKIWLDYLKTHTIEGMNA